MTGTAEIKNLATFKANAESTSPVIRISEGGTPRIVNSGVFEKTSGTERGEVEPHFENLGSIKEETGKLDFLKPVKAEPETQYGGSENPSAPGQAPLPKCGDPVECATGNFSEKQTDLAVGGRGVGLGWTRYYNSQAAAAANTKGMFGYGWTSSFSDHLVVEAGTKAMLVQADGSTVLFTDSGGKYTAPEWSEDTFGGSGSGYTLRLANQTMYKFNGSGRLESVIDRNGNETTLTYGGTGRLEKITGPAGRKITLAYNSEGLVESAKDPMGHTVKYTYESGELASVTEPGESSTRWQFKYNGSHEITTMTNGLGGKTVNEYNGSNQVTSQEDPAGRITTFEYESFQTKITNKASGEVIDEQFDSNGLPFSVTRGYGTSSATTETFTYNGMNEPLSVTDGDGYTTEYKYNSAGDRTSIINPDKDETQWTYDGTHDVLTVKTPKGETTTIKRNSDGDAETIERPAPGGKTQITKYKYNSYGEVEKVTDSLENTWTYGYDSDGDLTAETTPETEKRTIGYNEDSQEVWTVSPRGNASGELTKYMTGIERDEQGQPLKVTDPLGHTTKYTYDGDGNLETVTDGNGRKTTYTYDANNQPAKVKEPNGTVTETSYISGDRVTDQNDGNKQTTRYSRNVLGEVTRVTDPLNRETFKEYDAAGNLIKLTDPEKRITTYTYDPADRLTEISYSEGTTHSVKYEYDADGDRTSMVNGTGTTSYTYDELDRLTETKNGHGERVRYEYNLDNEQTRITYPNNSSITRAYDHDGRLQKVTDWAARTTQFTYNQNSDLTTTTYPETKGEAPEDKGEDTYTYNAADQMTQVKMTKGTLSLASIAYTRDDDGQVTGSTEKGLPGEETHSYTYDENNRLVKAGGGHEWEYDDANNPTKIGTRSYAYNAADELETRGAYTYNEEGERTKLTPSKAPSTTYRYDQAGNMTTFERAGEGPTKGFADTYAYDGNGLRATQTSSEGTKYMAWDMAEETPQILSDGQNNYIYGPNGLPIEQINSEGKALFLHHDQQGSTRLLTGSTGIVEGAMTYDPYGNLLASSGTKTTPLGYDGQYTNSETGLIYLRAREYDPATDQFLSVDPIAPVTRAPYSYTNDNPLDAADPSGLFCISFSASCLGEDVGEAVGVASHIGATVVQSSPVGQDLQLSSEISGLTEGLCAGASFVGGGNVHVSACYVSSPNGQSAITYTGEVGGGFPIGVSGFLGPMISNAQSPSDLGGRFNVAGASIGKEWESGGGSVAFGQDSCGQSIWQVAAGWTPNIGLGPPVGAYAGTSYTFAYESY